jgi:thioredoxin 1
MLFGSKKEKFHAMEINENNFAEILEKKDTGIFIDFWAPWCGPCKVMGPIVDELAEEFQDKNIVIGKVNVDQNPRISEAFKIKSIPTLAFIKDKRLIERISGLVPKPNLEEMLNDLIEFQFEEEEE